MAVFVLKNARIYVGGYDISCDTNQITLSTKADDVDVTTFCDGTGKRRIPGQIDTSVSASGFWHADSTSYKIDDIVSAKLAIADEIITVCASDPVSGDICYGVKSIILEYDPIGGSVGQAASYTMMAASNDLLIRGTIADAATKTTTGNSSALNIGAVSSTQKVYAGMHIIAASGTLPKITAIVQSDDNASFTSATTRISFAQQADIGAWWGTPLSGAITDTYWRFNYTISGTNPSFTIRTWIAIQ